MIRRYLVPFWVILLVIPLLAACQGNRQGQLKPLTLRALPSGPISGEPTEISFTELSQDPNRFRNQYVRATGSFSRLSPVVCTPYKGPRPRWGIVADELQMQVVGINEVLEIAPEAMPALLTVDGVWRFYQGPLGCGKEPAVGALWYLEAQRIFLPNPLVTISGENIAGDRTETAGPVTESTPTDSSGEEFAPELPPTPDLLLEETPLATPTFDPSFVQPVGTPTPNATRGGVPTVTPVNSSGGSDNGNNGGGNNGGGNNGGGGQSGTPNPGGGSSGQGTPTPFGTSGSGLATSTPGTPDPLSNPPTFYPAYPTNTPNY